MKEAFAGASADDLKPVAAGLSPEEIRKRDKWGKH